MLYGFFSGPLILVLEKSVALIHNWVLRVFDKIKLLESSESFTYFPDLRFSHRKWDTAHENAIVLLIPLTTCFDIWIIKS